MARCAAYQWITRGGMIHAIGSYRAIFPCGSVTMMYDVGLGLFIIMIS